MNRQNNLTLRQNIKLSTRCCKYLALAGVRALVTDLTDLEVYSLTMGALHYFETSDKLCASPSKEVKIPVACDLRSSSERLVHATSKAIVDAGYQVDYLGKIPTPCANFLCLTKTNGQLYGDRQSYSCLIVMVQKANRYDGGSLKTV